MRRLLIAVALSALVGFAFSSTGSAAAPKIRTVDSFQRDETRTTACSGDCSTASPTPLTTGKPAGRSCGLTARIDGVRYDVLEVRGAVPCRTVKRVVTTFLRGGTAAPPWTCFRGHGSSPYAASCARGQRVLVRVYAPT